MSRSTRFLLPMLGASLLSVLSPAGALTEAAVAAPRPLRLRPR